MDRTSKFLLACTLIASGAVVSIAFMCSTQSHEDYYAVGALNWQNDGAYQARAPALYVNFNQCIGNVSGHYFTLEQVKTLNFDSVQVERAYTYSDVFNTSERPGIAEGDMIVCKFEYYPPAHRYTVTEIQKLESVRNGSVWA